MHARNGEPSRFRLGWERRDQLGQLKAPAIDKVMPEHMLRNIVKLGRLPPFVDVFVPLGSAMSRNMSADEFEAWLIVIRVNHPDWAT